MEEQLGLNLDRLYSKIGYILACLSSYSSLDLSKRIYEINQNIHLIKKSCIEKKEYIDIRNVIAFRSQLAELEKRLPNDAKVTFDGHKISCLLFEVSIELKLLISQFSNFLPEDMKEYLEIASKYLYDCGRIVNIELLSYDNKI